MSFSDTWTESDPTGSTYANTLAVIITQAIKRALRERLAEDHCFYADETGHSDVGYHKQVTLPVLAADPSAVASAGRLYTKDVNAKAELFWEDEDENIIQLTNAGAVYVNSVPSGAIIMWSGTIANIPTGYVICDGENSTPNLLAKMIRGVATAATEPGTTGGADTHSHAAGTYAGPSHTHTGTTDSQEATVEADGLGRATPTHTHTFTTAAGGTEAVTGTSAESSSLPAYYSVAFIMKS